MLEKERKIKSNNTFLRLIDQSDDLYNQPWMLTKPGIFLPFESTEQKTIDVFQQAIQQHQPQNMKKLCYELEHHIAYFEKTFGAELAQGIHFYANPQYKFNLGIHVQEGIVSYTSEHIHPNDRLFKGTNIHIKPNKETIGAIENFSLHNATTTIIIKKHAIDRFQEKIHRGHIQKRYALQELIKDLETSKEVQRETLIELPEDRWRRDVYYKGNEGIYCFTRTAQPNKLVLQTCYSAVDKAIEKKYRVLK